MRAYLSNETGLEVAGPLEKNTFFNCHHTLIKSKYINLSNSQEPLGTPFFYLMYRKIMISSIHREFENESLTTSYGDIARAVFATLIKIKWVKMGDFQRKRF